MNESGRESVTSSSACAALLLYFSGDDSQSIALAKREETTEPTEQGTDAAQNLQATVQEILLYCPHKPVLIKCIRHYWILQQS